MSVGVEESSSPHRYVRGAFAENTPFAERALLGRGLRRSALQSVRVPSITSESPGYNLHGSVDVVGRRPRRRVHFRLAIRRFTGALV